MHRHSQGHRHGHGQSRGHKHAHRHTQTHITLAEAKGRTSVETPRLLEGCEARLYPTFVDQSSHKTSRHCRPIRPQIEKPIHSSHGHQHLDTGLLAPPVLQRSCAGGPSEGTRRRHAGRYAISSLRMQLARWVTLPKKSSR